MKNKKMKSKIIEMSLSNFEKIVEFHQCSGLVHNTVPQHNVVTEQPELVKLRVSLIKEESQELVDATNNHDFVEMIDALADLLYVTYGACSSFGINASKAYVIYNVKYELMQNITILNPNLVSLVLSDILTNVEDLSRSITNNIFLDIQKALFAILRSTYKACQSFGIDSYEAFGLVHESNMTKFCISEQEARNTVASYKNDSRYDTPTYRLAENGKYVVFNQSTGKILKSINYKPVSFESILAKHQPKHRSTNYTDYIGC